MHLKIIHESRSLSFVNDRLESTHNDDMQTFVKWLRIHYICLVLPLLHMYEDH